MFATLAKGALLAMALALAGFALAAPTQGQSPGDRAFGSGHVLLTDFTADIQSGPNGENPVGSLVLSGYLDFTATPTCTRTAGNVGVGGYRIDTGPRAGEGFLSAAVDNGPPEDGRPVDDVLYSGTLPTPPTTCPAPGEDPPPDFSSTGFGPLTSGDLTIIDGGEGAPPPAPPPTARIEDVSVRLVNRPRRFTGPPVLPGPASSAAARKFVVVRARVCGRPGMVALHIAESGLFAAASSPVIATRLDLRVQKHSTRCRVHRVRWRPGTYRSAQNHRVAVSARTTGLLWSRTVARRVRATG